MFIYHTVDPEDHRIKSDPSLKNPTNRCDEILPKTIANT